MVTNVRQRRISKHHPQPRSDGDAECIMKDLGKKLAVMISRQAHSYKIMSSQSTAAPEKMSDS